MDGHACLLSQGHRHMNSRTSRHQSRMRCVCGSFVTRLNALCHILAKAIGKRTEHRSSALCTDSSPMNQVLLCQAWQCVLGETEIQNNHQQMVASPQIETSGRIDCTPSTCQSSASLSHQVGNLLLQLEENDTCIHHPSVEYQMWVGTVKFDHSPGLSTSSNFASLLSFFLAGV